MYHSVLSKKAKQRANLLRRNNESENEIATPPPKVREKFDVLACSAFENSSLSPTRIPPTGQKTNYNNKSRGRGSI